MIIVAVIISIYMIVYNFYIVGDISNCKNNFGHIKENKIEVYSDKFISSYNPTIFKLDNEILYGIRKSTNGTKNLNFDTLLNHHKLSIVDKDFNLLVKHDSIFKNQIIKDIRIFNYKDKHLGIGSINIDNTIKPVIMIFTDKMKVLYDIKYLSSEDTKKGIPAKNWIIIHHSNKILIQTDIYPKFKIQQIQEKDILDKNKDRVDVFPYLETSRNIDNILKTDSKEFIVKKLHGTSNWVKLNNGNYITIIHTFHQVWKNIKYLRRIYRSMFIEIDKNKLEIIRYSDWLCFGKQCYAIQFASTLFKENDEIIVGIGVNDNYSEFIYYQEKEIVKSLKYN